MWLSSILGRLTGTSWANSRHRPEAGRRHSRRPTVEQLESRLTPAQVGANDFRISFMGPDGNKDFDATSVAMAYNSRDHEYLVVWAGEDATDNELEVYGQRLDAATGASIGGRIRISDMGPDGNTTFRTFSPAVAYNDTANEYLVVWAGADDTDFGNGPLVAEEFEIFGQRLDAATGAQVGTNDFRISDMGPDGNASFDALSPAVAYNGTNKEYLVVWQGSDDTGALVASEFEVYGQRLDAMGGQVGANDFRISDMGPDGSTSFGVANPALAYNGVNNEYLVVWQGDDNTGTLVDGEQEIFGQRLNAATGAEVGTNDFRISDMGLDGDNRFTASQPAVAYNHVNNEYLVVWSADDTLAPPLDDEFEIFGQRLDGATGAEVGTNDFVLSDMGPDGNKDFSASGPAVAFNGVANEYLVVWHGDDYDGTLGDGEFEIFGQRLDGATGAELGDNDFRLSDLGPDGNSAFDGGFAAVAYNDAANEYLIVWQGDDDTAPLVDDETEIFGQRFAQPVPPAPTPAPTPDPAQIVATTFRREGVAQVRVQDAATGALRAVLTPFRGFRGRLAVQMRDVNGDGVLDLLVSAQVGGKRRLKVFDARTLAPLPARR